MSSRQSPRVVLLRLCEAAAYLGVGKRFMRRLVNERRIRHRKLGQYLYFDVADLDAFRDSRIVEPAADARL